MTGEQANKLGDVKVVLNMVKDHQEFGTSIADCDICTIWVPRAITKLGEVLDADG